ncbi:S1/P1 nuclease [Mesonia aestuariivivens]|uniref:S1/P1 nuclease n=1 Tax=Mesonia aestuariivivens TaxID=2796128 RepID=A0ABS6VZ06_9FLAO|nr:S1/P1 nuclease [Mesonia aestuariivivens]MBW2960815.1 S1/P1 nuclease [Mesonia aestuariivivens]
MKIKIFLLIVILSLGNTIHANNKEDWGKNGHRSTAKIAEGYLKRKTARKIEKLLDGKSLALVSTFGDDIKSDPKYRKYSKWHYVNIPEGKTYAEVENQLGENLIWAIQECVSKLKNEHTSKKDKQFFLKMLVHLVGDLHQPLHVGRAEDKGGNDIEVKWFNKSSNLHRVWDSEMINFFDMSYSDLAINQKKLTKKELKAIQEGDVVDWAQDSRVLVNKVYNSAKEGDKLYYGYMYDWFTQVRAQLQKGGIRLAVLLNDVFA